MKRGLTMIEMLVVIGIIGILMAALLGTFSGSTESARAAKCLANMHTLAMGVQGHAMTVGTYPFAGTVTTIIGGDKTVNEQGWIGWATATSTDPGGSYCSPTEKNLDKRRYSLTNGVLHVALRGATTAYVCPTHLRICRDKKYPDPLWSYVMNGWFGWEGAESTSPSDPPDRTDRKLLFAELPFAQTSTERNIVVQDGKFSYAATDRSDPVLQYDGIKGGGNEMIGFNHKSGKSVVGHVCFCDGHTEKLRIPPTGLSEQKRRELTKWLCLENDDDGEPFDISFDGKEYKKIQ